jgi:hypothetical protein
MYRRNSKNVNRIHGFGNYYIILKRLLSFVSLDV